MFIEVLCENDDALAERERLQCVTDTQSCCSSGSIPLQKVTGARQHYAKQFGKCFRGTALNFARSLHSFFSIEKHIQYDVTYVMRRHIYRPYLSHLSRLLLISVLDNK